MTVGRDSSTTTIRWDSCPACCFFNYLFHVYWAGTIHTAFPQEKAENVMHVRRLASANVQSLSLVRQLQYN